MHFRFILPIFGAVIAASAALAEYKQDALCVSGAAELCATIPGDLPGLSVNQGYTPNTNARPGTVVNQQNFDYFGWQSFVALNWPADTTGHPIGSILDDTAAPRVWEFYAGIEDVFADADIVDDGAAASCAPQGRLLLSQTSKLTSSSFIEPFTTSPLIDTDGNFVMYDVRMNPVEVKYLTENNLTTIEGQKIFAGKNNTPWDLPRGTVDGPGAMELKTSWRVLKDDENPMGYFTAPATLLIGKDNSATGAPLCLEVTVGLVGMHIMHKITNPGQFSDFWVWATFEHAKNAPDAAKAAPSQTNTAAVESQLIPYPPVSSCPVPADVSGDWAFFDPTCKDASGAACAPNVGLQLQNYLWAPDMPYAEKYLTQSGSGTQVTRCWEVYESAKNIDKVFHAALAGSVWANYNLIGVQWAQSGLDIPDPLRPFPAPIYLVNSTLETFLQNKPVLTKEPHKRAVGSSSCVLCHDIARDNAGSKSDFSFLGQHAK
ncbi:MAG: hypothetical protein WA790_04590 [Sulfitobacter sp.]